jgi:hypothetical protein
MVEIEEKGPPLSEADVLSLEKYLGTSLPDQYRRFLLSCNGGRPSLDVVTIPNLRGGEKTDLQVFFGLGRPHESSDVRWNFKTFSGRVPRGLLPVACDSGGSLFCLATTGRDVGKVFFWDSGNSFYTTSDDLGQVYLVGQSFDAFLKGLGSNIDPP